MVFIGVKKIIKNNGNIEKVKCDYCGNISKWEFVSYRKWFVFMFLPLFPIEKSTNYVVCPVCDHGLVLTKEEKKQIKYKIKHNIMNKDNRKQ